MDETRSLADLRADFLATSTQSMPLAGLTVLFLSSIASIAVTGPLVLIGARAGGEPTLVVLGMAILVGVIGIPYGFAARDPVGLRHAIARAIGCYVAWWVAPEPLRAITICGVVALATLCSLNAMKQPGAVSPD